MLGWARWERRSSSHAGGTRADEAKIIEWSRAQLANYKVPRSVHVVPELPVNAAGKVVKTELRERLRRPS